MREGLLIELGRHGYCDTWLTADDLTGGGSADEITELVLRREGFLEEGRDIAMVSHRRGTKWLAWSGIGCSIRAAAEPGLDFRAEGRRLRGSRIAREVTLSSSTARVECSTIVNPTDMLGLAG